jgi:hypothetical protein
VSVIGETDRLVKRTVRFLRYNPPFLKAFGRRSLCLCVGLSFGHGKRASVNGHLMAHDQARVLLCTVVPIHRTVAFCAHSYHPPIISILIGIIVLDVLYSACMFVVWLITI